MPALTWNEFAPDLDPTAPGNITDMRGFKPTEKGVATVASVTQLCAPLASECMAAYSATLLDKQLIFEATATDLFLVQNGLPVDLGGGFTFTHNSPRFAPYGQDLIIVDGVDVAQFYRLSSNALAPLPGNPPLASIVASTDYAVILVPPNSQTLYSNLSDTAPWIPNIATQVYQYNLAQIPGDITSVQRKRSLMVVYRATAIQCATFVGGFIGWDFGQPGTISMSVGVKSHEMIVNTGDYDYFVGPDDFWQFDGYSLTRIPNHVKEWFFGSKGVVGDLNQTFAQNMVGHYDNVDDIVMWHYPSNTTVRGLAGGIDSLIGFYNRGQPRWFMDRLSIETALTGFAPGLHAVAQLNHALVKDDDTAAFNLAQAYVTSQDFGDRQHVFQTRRIMPGFTTYPVPPSTGPAASVTPLVQMKVGTTPIAKPTKAISNDGWFNFMTTGRLTRFQIAVNGHCELTQGMVDINMTGEV